MTIANTSSDIGLATKGRQAIIWAVVFSFMKNLGICENVNIVRADYQQQQTPRHLLRHNIEKNKQLTM